MSWSRLFELFIIISLIVCAIKIGSEKIEVEKERKELLDIANRATATLDKAKYCIANYKKLCYGLHMKQESYKHMQCEILKYNT